MLRDPGFNVAYWNLPTRPVSPSATARWYVKGDVPLRLFHFSGFDPARPHVLSKHQDRIRLATIPTSRASASAYADGADRERRPARWPTGPTPTTRARRGSRSTGSARRSTATSSLDGFDDVAVRARRGEAAFAEAATAPAAVGGEYGVTRYLATLYELARRPAAAPSPTSATRPTGAASSTGRTRSGATRSRSPSSCCRRARALVRAPANGARAGARRRPAPAWRIARRRRRRARRQRRRLPELRARRRRGRAPGHRRARRRRRADAAGRADGAAQPPGPRLRPRRRLARTTTPSTSSASTPTCCPRLAAQVGPSVLRGPPHDRPVVVGGLGVPRALARLVRARRRAVGGVGVRRRGARRGLAGAGRAHADAGDAAAGAPRPTRAAVGPARGLPVPVRLRLQLGARAQEPAGAARRVPARVPRPGRGRARSCSRASTPSTTPTSTTGCGSRRPGHPHVHLLDFYVSAEREERPDRRCRLLRVAAPLRGLRDHDGRGDAARQAGGRHGLLRQPRLHEARERLPRRLRAGADRPGPRPLPRRRRSGPSPTSTTRRS